MNFLPLVLGSTGGKFGAFLRTNGWDEDMIRVLYTTGITLGSTIAIVGLLLFGLVWMSNVSPAFRKIMAGSEYDKSKLSLWVQKEDLGEEKKED